MNKVVIGVIAFVVLALFGLGFYAERHITVLGEESGQSTQTVYVATTTLRYEATTTEVEVPGGRTYSTGRTATAYTGYSSQPAYVGPAYRNTIYGLTVPGIYQVTESAGGVYAGVPTSASYNFYTNGVLAFTINVWSKEAWNNIRIQETINVAETKNVNQYFGEGHFLGSNKVWIYSYIPGSYTPPTGIRFY